MAIDFNKFLKKETPAKTSGIDFSKFIKTPIAPTTPVRTAGLPAFLGGGTYSIQEPGELYKTERGYGAIEAPGEYREHIFPVALGGTSPGKGEKDLETDNIKVYGKDLGEQKSAYENDIIRQYKAGDVTLGQARGLVLKKYRELTGLDPEQKTTFENFVETGIDRLKHPIKATISDIKNIKNIFSKSKEINPQTTQAVKDLYEATKIDPTKPILKNSVEDYIKSIYETDKETIERVKTLFTEKTDTKSEKVGQGLKALTGVADTIFSPITAAFAASKNIPVLGGIASVINLPLALGGDTLTNLSNEGLNGLVSTDNMSKQTAENIREGVNEVASLAAQIGIAGKMFKGRETKVKELEAKYGKRDAETIMKKAEEKATIEAKAKIAIEPKIDFNKFIPKEEVKAEVKTEPIQQEITKAKAEVKSFEEFMKERLSKKDIDNIDKINVIEDSSSIILTDIYALNKGQRTGSKIMNELKDYADLTGKKVRIGMVANQDFFNKFKWLKKLGKQDVIYSYDPNKFILENEYANKLKKIYTEVEDTFKYDNKILAEKQKNLIKKYPEIKENYAIREDGTIRLSEIEDAIKEIEYDNTFDIVKVNVNKIKPVNEEWTKTSRKLKTLEEEIKKDGYIKQPLIVNKVTGLTEDGNHRIIVAKKLGIKEVPVIYINDGKLGLQDLSKTKSELKQLWDKIGTTARPISKIGKAVRGVEEFAEPPANILYHGTTKASAENIDKVGFIKTKGGFNKGRGISVSSKLSISEAFATGEVIGKSTAKNGVIYKLEIKPNAKILEGDEFLSMRNEIAKQIELSLGDIKQIAKNNAIGAEDVTPAMETKFKFQKANNKIYKQLEKEGYRIELIDLRTIKPIDKDLICESAFKTCAVLIVDVAWKTCGVSAEVLAVISEKVGCFCDRLTLPDCPAPSSAVLEMEYYINSDDIINKVKEMVV